MFNKLISITRKKLIAVFINLLVLFSSCQINRDSNLQNISAEEMRRTVQMELPVGSSKEQVINFLKKENIEFSEQNIFKTTPLGEENLEWISCAIQQNSLIHNNYKLILRFYFDRNNKKLVRYEITNSYSSL